MSNITLLNESSINQNVDVIVNTTNRKSAPGGVCREIFKRTNIMDLMIKYTYFKRPLPDGSAVITAALKIKNAKYIIHSVGSDFSETPTAFKELFEAYYKSLCVLKENDLHSISFPLISSGIYSGDLENPVAESTKQCLLAYKKFISDYSDYEIDVKVCAYSPESMKEAKPVFESML